MKIVGYHTIGGLQVPHGQDGRLLDRLAVSGDEAPLLTSPFGPLHFFVGSIDRYAILDFAELPSGKFVLDAYGAKPWLHQEDWYQIHGPGDVVAAAYTLVERVLEGLDAEGVGHDADAHRSDPFYFMRAIAREARCPRYAGLPDEALRFPLEALV